MRNVPSNIYIMSEHSFFTNNYTIKIGIDLLNILYYKNVVSYSYRNVNLEQFIKSICKIMIKFTFKKV